MTITRRQFLASTSLIVSSPYVFSVSELGKEKDKKILGEVTHRSAADIAIKIISPYQNLTASRHIPYFARPYRSYDGPDGEKTAKMLLDEIYEIGFHLDKNMQQLKRNFCRTNRQTCRLIYGNTFFEKGFPMMVPHDTREEIIEILVGKKQLYSKGLL